jgi:dipeptidase
LIAANHYQEVMQDVEDYQLKEMAYAHERVNKIDSMMADKEASGSHVVRALGQANARTADHIMTATEALLTKLVIKTSQDVPGSFNREHY